MCETLTALFVSMRAPLAVARRTSYLRASAKDVDDALLEAYPDLLARPQLSVACCEGSVGGVVWGPGGAGAGDPAAGAGPEVAAGG